MNRFFLFRAQQRGVRYKEASAVRTVSVIVRFQCIKTAIYFQEANSVAVACIVHLTYIMSVPALTSFTFLIMSNLFVVILPKTSSCYMQNLASVYSYSHMSFQALLICNLLPCSALYV